jgi:proteasome lid subunit RPN8/RPN11
MVVIPRAQHDEIIAHAQETPEAESCGILAGKDGRVERVYRARNDAEQPRSRYTLHPKDMLAIMREIDDTDQDTIGFYHSHTHTSAYPSPDDVDRWLNPGWYKDSLCFICSLADSERPTLRAFTIRGVNDIDEEPIAVEG